MDVVRGKWALTRTDGTLTPPVTANALSIRFYVARIVVPVTINLAAGQIDPTNGSPVNFTVPSARR